MTNLTETELRALVKEYDMSDMSTSEVIAMAKRYLSSMPDSQVKAVLFLLVERFDNEQAIVQRAVDEERAYAMSVLDLLWQAALNERPGAEKSLRDAANKMQSRIGQPVEIDDE